MKYLFTLAKVLLLSGTLFAQNALHFDGVDDYTQAPAAGPSGTSNRTVEAWVNMDAIVSTQIVVLDYGDMSFGQRFTLNIIDGFPRIEIGGEGVSSTTQLSTGTWYHLAATYDNLSPTPFKLYINGVLAASGNFSVPINTSSINGIIIGRRNDGINHFIGSIDEVRVWSFAKLPSQITADLNNEYCTSQVGLEAYYKFNQGVAGGSNITTNMLLDASPNQNHAMLNNFTLAGNTSNWVVGKQLNGDSFNNITDLACNSYTAPSGIVYTSTGTYFDTIPNAAGCDSVITLNLTIIPNDTSVSQFGAALQSNQPAAFYQWLDCNNNYAVIPGATNQTFFPAANGSYAVQVDVNGCIDTSSCTQVLNVGVQEAFENSILVSPNPTSGLVNIELDKISGDQLQITLFDVNGKIQYSDLHRSISKTTIDLGQLQNGVYFLELRNQDGVLKRKVIKF